MSESTDYIASYEVMNNDDLRAIIWSFFREIPRIRCNGCDIGLVYLNEKKPYMSYHYGTIESMEYFCYDCVEDAKNKIIN